MFSADLMQLCCVLSLTVPDASTYTFGREAARSAEMGELQAQLKRMLARSRDLSIARLGAQLPDLFDYYQPPNSDPDEVAPTHASNARTSRK